jgi:hypothetical protein
MKTIKHLLAALAFIAMLFLTLDIRAQHSTATDGYVTYVAPTNGTTPEVIFAGAPTKTIRVTGLNAEGTTNAAHLVVFIGATPFTVTGVINVTNLTVTSNAGVVIGQPVILQNGGTNWYATVHTTNQLTNVVLALGSGLGFTPLTNSVLWKCQTYVEQLGIGKKQASGPAVFSGVVRGPLGVRLEPPAVASASNRLAVAVYYGTAGSP